MLQIKVANLWHITLLADSNPNLCWPRSPVPFLFMKIIRRSLSQTHHFNSNSHQLPIPWCLNPHDVEITSPSLMLSKSSTFSGLVLATPSIPGGTSTLRKTSSLVHGTSRSDASWESPAAPQHPWRRHGGRGWRRWNRRNRGEGNPHRQTSWACRGALELEDELKNWFPGNFWILCNLMIYGWFLNDVWMMYGWCKDALWMLCNCGSFVNDLWIICGLFGYMICRLYYSNSALTTFFWMIKYSENTCWVPWHRHLVLALRVPSAVVSTCTCGFTVWARQVLTYTRFHRDCLRVSLGFILEFF